MASDIVMVKTLTRIRAYCVHFCLWYSVDNMILRL